MNLKNFGSKTIDWLRNHNPPKASHLHPQIDDDGLITEQIPSQEQIPTSKDSQDNQLIVKALKPSNKTESLEKLQAGFDKLIENLQSINEHLNRQVDQHEGLMNRMEKLPQLLENFPAVVENQKQLTQDLIEQSKAAAIKNQQFIEAVEKIPAETGKQTDALIDIDHQLAAAADTDVQIAENFNRFNESLDKLNQNSVGQTDSIMQMSKTFSTSDRYLKYIISRQNKRFVWVFITALSVSALAILILTGIIIYLTQ